MSWPGLKTTLLLLCLTAFGAVASAQVRPGLVATSSQDHIWFAVETGRAGGPVSLLHIPAALASPTYNTIYELPAMPEVMAAWKEQLWLVFPPEAGASDRREVFSLRISFNPTLERYFAVPADRLVQEPPLPKEGTIVSAVGTKDGLVVMITDPSHAPEPGTRRVGTPDGPTRAPSVEGPGLLILRRGQWEKLPDLSLPDSEAQVDLAGPIFLGVRGPQRDDITALVGIIRDSSAQVRAAVLTLTSGQTPTWDSRLVEIDLDRIQGVITVGGRLMLVEEPPPFAGASSQSDPQAAPSATGEAGQSSRADVISLAYVHADGRLPLVEVDRPAVENWAILGTASGADLLEVLGPDRYMIRHIRTNNLVSAGQDAEVQASDGLIGTPRELEPASDLGPALWQITVLSGLMMGLVLLLLLVRPPARGTEQALPTELQLMPLSARFLGLLIDLVPGGLIAVIVLGAQVTDLIRIPTLNLTMIEGLPYIVMVTVTVIHEGLSEQIWGTTLGKMLFGGQVISLQGGRPDRGRLLIRSLVKWIVLLLPVLAVVNILSRLLQGVHDQAAGTLVIRRGTDAVPPSTPK